MTKLLSKSYLFLSLCQLILLTHHSRRVARFETNLVKPDNVFIMRSSAFEKCSKIVSTRTLELCGILQNQRNI